MAHGVYIGDKYATLGHISLKDSLTKALSPNSRHFFDFGSFSGLVVGTQIEPYSPSMVVKNGVSLW